LSKVRGDEELLLLQFFQDEWQVQLVVLQQVLESML
jgi:hypothetical protein